MRKAFVVIAVIGISAALLLAGCVQKVASSKDAIEATKSMQTVQQKVNYLVGQANAFYNSKDFQQAIDIAQYVLANLDKNSTDAKSIIEKAKAELAKLGQQKLNELKGKVGLK